MAKVESIGKFGFVADGVRYKYSDVAVKQVDIVPGAEIAVGNGTTVIAPITPPVDSERAKKFTPTYTKKVEASNTMSKAEWQAKDRSQLIGGLSHDAAAIAVAVLNLDGSNEPGTESALRVYRTLLEGMIKIREELK